MTRKTRQDGDPESGNEGSSGLPGKRRFEKMASSSGTQAGRAYQGAVESVFAIVMAAGLGYWADSHFGTSPRWLVVGSIVGFAAFVLRLARMAMLIEKPRDPLDQHPHRERPASLDREETGGGSIDDPEPSEEENRREQRLDETE